MKYMTPDDRVFIAGHRGLIGSALTETLQDKGYKNLILKNRAEVDLLDSRSVEQFFAEYRPDVVIHAAAKVGGIHANNTCRADFIYENFQLETNVIWAAHKHHVRRLIFLGSSCIYPREVPQPMSETCLLTWPLEMTNRPNAIAKIAGLELVNSLRQQYGRDYFSVMPTKPFGPDDNYHLEDSLALPSLIRRFVDAADSNVAEVVVWGTGTPRREFMYSLDCAEAIVHLGEHLSPDALNQSQQGKLGFYHVNIGVGEDISIKELAYMIAELTGYKGKIRFDHSKPDGAMKKMLDVEFLKSMREIITPSLANQLATVITDFRRVDIRA